MTFGTKTGGRKKGTPNKTSGLLKEAILLAAQEAGKKLHPNDDDGLVAYCRFLAMEHPTTFSNLLGRVLPMQVTGANGGPIEVNHKGLESLTDEQLETIAAGGSVGAFEASEGTSKLN
jgi:hypothetical protein